MTAKHTPQTPSQEPAPSGVAQGDKNINRLSAIAETNEAIEHCTRKIDAAVKNADLPIELQDRGIEPRIAARAAHLLQAAEMPGTDENVDRAVKVAVIELRDVAESLLRIGSTIPNRQSGMARYYEEVEAKKQARRQPR